MSNKYREKYLELKNKDKYGQKNLFSSTKDLLIRLCIVTKGQSFEAIEKQLTTIPSTLISKNDMEAVDHLINRVGNDPTFFEDECRLKKKFKLPGTSQYKLNEATCLTTDADIADKYKLLVSTYLNKNKNNIKYAYKIIDQIRNIEEKSEMENNIINMSSLYEKHNKKAFTKIKEEYKKIVIDVLKNSYYYTNKKNNEVVSIPEGFTESLISDIKIESSSYKDSIVNIFKDPVKKSKIFFTTDGVKINDTFLDNFLKMEKNDIGNLKNLIKNIELDIIKAVGPIFIEKLASDVQRLFYVSSGSYQLPDMLNNDYFKKMLSKVKNLNYKGQINKPDIKDFPNITMNNFYVNESSIRTKSKESPSFDYDVFNSIDKNDITKIRYTNMVKMICKRS
jgi:hypothetical protein